HVARTLGSAHAADIAEALNAIEPGAAARVLAALPFDQAVRTLNQPELDRPARLFEHLPTDKAVALVAAMSADQRADLFRELPGRTRARLFPAIDAATKESLRSLLGYPPTTAGGIMTTERRPPRGRSSARSRTSAPRDIHRGPYTRCTCWTPWTAGSSTW